MKVYEAASIAIDCEHALDHDGYEITGNIRTSSNQSHAAFELVHEGVRYVVSVKMKP